MKLGKINEDKKASETTNEELINLLAMPNKDIIKSLFHNPELLPEQKRKLTSIMRLGKYSSLDKLCKDLDELEEYQKLGTVIELQKSVKEEDVLKFYYIESLNEYAIGQGDDWCYYRVVGLDRNGKVKVSMQMSRYLPFGRDPYPSEPKEIEFQELA